ncbi:MAG: hypothetical protein JO352_22970 [Chloroflexi bacterium]|nr:hypothetical protein [Chloroflexota bacterium]
MVLDAKALTWAAKNDIDTAKLKKARVPIYGKWYFPEIPPDVALVNLETGEQESFRQRMIAGEVIYVPAADLARAGLAPADFAPMDVGPGPTLLEPEAPRAMVAVAPEPMFAMARPPGLPREIATVETDPDAELATEFPPELAGLHMPRASVAPFVLGIGFCLALLGLITSLIIVIAGLLWMAVGAIAWIRIGMLEYRGSHEQPELETEQVT